MSIWGKDIAKMVINVTIIFSSEDKFYIKTTGFMEELEELKI